MFVHGWIAHFFLILNNFLYYAWTLLWLSSVHYWRTSWIVSNFVEATKLPSAYVGRFWHGPYYFQFIWMINTRRLITESKENHLSGGNHQTIFQMSLHFFITTSIINSCFSILLAFGIFIYFWIVDSFTSVMCVSLLFNLQSIN